MILRIHRDGPGEEAAGIAFRLLPLTFKQQANLHGGVGGSVTSIPSAVCFQATGSFAPRSLTSLTAPAGVAKDPEDDLVAILGPCHGRSAPGGSCKRWCIFPSILRHIDPLRVPVPVLADGLGAPMKPHADLGLIPPDGRLEMVAERFPGRLAGPLGDRNLDLLHRRRCGRLEGRSSRSM